MKFAYSSNAYTRFSLKQAIESIGKAGFDGIEILGDIPHLVPGIDIRLVKKWLRSFPISNVNANTARFLRKSGDGFWPRFTDIRNRARRIEYIQWVIKTAHEIGADCVSISTGPPTRKDNGLVYDSLEKILKTSEQYNIKIGIEYEPGHLIGTWQDLQNVLNIMNHPLLGANLDIGHSVCNNEDVVRVIKSLHKKIWNIHLEDIKKRVHFHLIPGHGDINFTKIKTALKSINYKRFVTLELYPYKKVPEVAGKEGLDYLQSLNF